MERNVPLFVPLSQTSLEQITSVQVITLREDGEQVCRSDDQETNQKFDQRIQEAEEADKAVEPLKLVVAEREGLPLRVSVRRSPSGGGEIGAEMLRGRQLWLWTIKRALTQPVKVLQQHRWTIMKPAKGYKWITSDDPVMRLNYNNLSDYKF